MAAYARLEEQLKAQIEACNAAKLQVYAAGDKETAAQYLKEQKTFTQDLELLQHRRLQGLPVPLYNYMEKTYTRTVSHTDIPTDQLELSVMRAFKLPLPSGYKTLDTYVTLEVPYPSDQVHTAQTSTVKQSLDPGTPR